MSDHPQISVIIAAYKAEDHIAAALKAARQQRNVELEIIIVDDHSPTDLQPVIKDLAAGDKRVTCVRLDQNGGPAAARNHAIGLATGDFIAILDADDGMADDRLALLLELAESTGADIVADNMLEVQVGSKTTASRHFLDMSGMTSPLAVTLLDLMQSGMSGRFNKPLGYVKPLIRRETLIQQSTLYDTSLTNSEDHYLLATLLANGAKMRMTTWAGYTYTRHDQSLSYRITAAQADAIIAAEKAFAARFSSELTKDEMQASTARITRFQKTARFEGFISTLKRRHITKAMGQMLRYPSNIAGLFQIAWKRVT